MRARWKNDLKESTTDVVENKKTEKRCPTKEKRWAFIWRLWRKREKSKRGQ